MRRILLNDAYSPRRPWVAQGDLHLNFVEDRHFWGGRERFPYEFTSFLGGIRTASGLLCTGVIADINISELLSDTGITAPFAIIARFTSTDSGSTKFAASIDDGTATNRITVGHVSGAANVIVVTGGVVQANSSVASAVVDGQPVTIGFQIETNNGLQSVNGSTGAAADTTVTVPTVTQLVIGRRGDGSGPFVGTIHHIVIAAGTRDQTALNTLCAAVHAIPLASS